MTNKVDLGFLTADEFISRRSDSLKDNPNAILSEKVEVERYVSSLDSNYRNEIVTLSNCINQKLSEKVRMIVTIVAYKEGNKIKNTLEKYLNQDIDSSLFEIIILDNHPSTTEKDDTENKVNEFRRENPRISIIYAHKVWGEGDYATVGNARKYVLDIAVYRIANRDNFSLKTILITNDADTISFDLNYLSSILEEFDTNLETEALVTSSVVPFEVIIKPNIYAVLTLWGALDDIVAEGEPYNLIGRSSAYNTSIYTAIGGYNPKGKMAGDLETGFLVADARGWNPKSVIQFKKTRHVQDPRRILEAIANRVPVNEMYYKFVSNPEIREVDNEKLLSFIPDNLDWELFEDDVDSFWQGRSTGMYKWRGKRFEDDFRNAMEKIGVKYEIVDDRVKLKNLDDLRFNYEKEFGKNINIIHSSSKPWDQEKQDKMKIFFGSISDSIIGVRNREADKTAALIKSFAGSKDSEKFIELLKDYKRFAGVDYVNI